jgi:hypothetical protein
MPGMRGRASVTPARFSLVGMIDDAETDRGALALAVWIYSALWGTVLGAIGGFVALMVGTSTWGFGWIIAYSVAAAILAGGFGFIVGNIIGLLLALIVYACSVRARVGIVTVAIPVVAVTVSVTATILLFGATGGGSRVVIAIDAALTLIGAIWICARYRELERTFDDDARAGVESAPQASRVH